MAAETQFGFLQLPYDLQQWIVEDLDDLFFLQAKCVASAALGMHPHWLLQQTMTSVLGCIRIVSVREQTGALRRSCTAAIVRDPSAATIKSY